MTYFQAIREGSRSEPGKLAEGIGLTLVIVGLANGTGVVAARVGTDAPSSAIAVSLMLAMALLLDWLSPLAVHKREGRLVGVKDLVRGLGLLAALVGLWLIAADNGISQTPLPGHALSWIALLSIAGMIMVAWRLSGRWLALAASAAFVLVAIWHASTWRPDLDGQQAAPLDAVLDIAGTLWFDRTDGMFGRVFDVILSSVFPLFVVGSLLASRISHGSKVGSGLPAGGLRAALQSASLLLIPTLIIGSLFMLERPGTGLATIALVWLVALSSCLVWFWVSPTHGPKTVSWFDLISVGLTFLTLATAMAAGVSLQHSAIIALGVVIAFSFFDADVRAGPAVLLIALAQSGIAFAALLITAGAVGLVLAVLDHSGLPIDVAWLLAGAAGEAPFPLLLAAAITAIIAGLVMPGFAAYLIVAALLGPSLRTVGIADPTAHGLILAVAAIAVGIGRGTRPKTA